MILNDEFLTEDQVAEMLGVKAKTLRNRSAMRNAPPRIKVGHKVLYRRSAVTAWLESLETALRGPLSRGRRLHGEAA